MRPQASHSSHQTASRRAAPRRASRLRIMLLATSALASAALPTTVAHADPVDATWLPTQPVDGDAGNFNNANHWTGSDGFTIGTATFNASNIRDIKFNAFNALTTVGGIAVTSGAG